MARQPKVPLPDGAASDLADIQSKPDESGFELARSIGIIERGRSRWWPAGHRFDLIADRELISRLHREGAVFR